MATVSPPRVAPAMAYGLRSVLGRVLPGAATVVGVAALLALALRPDSLNYDARYSLLWARDIWQGFRPDYTAPFAPTPHPLQTAVSFLALPFGGGADGVMTALILLSFGGLVWLAYRLGAELSSPAVGLVAAAVVLTRPTIERFALLGYQDVTFAMLVLGALLLEVRERRRGAPVLALLAVAGLIRPDGWLLAGLYLLYLWPAATPRRRALFVALTLLAPVLWAAQDWLVTGNPLHSLHGTSGLAEEVDRVREPSRLPFLMAGYLKLTLREPLALGVPIGLAFAWRHARRRWALPVAVAVVLSVLTVVQALAGLPFVPRYVLTPAVLLALVYGLGVFGWRALAPGAARRRWRAMGLLSLGLSIAYVPWHAGKFEVLERHIELNRKLDADLRLAGESPAVRSRFAACGSISSIGHRPVPHLRYWLGGGPGSVQTVEGRTTRVGPLLLKPRPTPALWRFYRRHFSRVQVPPGHREIYVNDSWRVYAAPGCRDGELRAPPGGAGA